MGNDPLIDPSLVRPADPADGEPRTGLAEAVPHPGTARGEIAELYRQTIRPLASMLRKHLGAGPPDPDDIAQLAFQKLIERPTLADIDNVEAFLWRTARNLVFKERRAQDVRARYDFEIEQLYFALRGYDPDPERVVSAKEQINLVKAMLQSMPERRRRAFVLHRIEGLTIAATARRLKISATAVGKHIARAMAEIDDVLLRNTPRGKP